MLRSGVRLPSSPHFFRQNRASIQDRQGKTNPGSERNRKENIGKKIIKVEVKACRAINTKLRGGLETKALSFESDEPYWMNFQQIKLDIADAFIFVGVWVDKILDWVLTNKEVKKHPTRSHQHRGGIEYQIGITEKNIKEFKKFLVEPSQLVDTIKSKIKK